MRRTKNAVYFKDLMKGYKSPGPKRTPSESFDEYKNRMALEKLLLKFLLRGKKLLKAGRGIKPEEKMTYTCPTCNHVHTEGKK